MVLNFVVVDNVNYYIVNNYIVNCWCMLYFLCREGLKGFKEIFILILFVKYFSVE